jgi:DNA invertase Pin-like site-specific DNA recombinase
VDPATSGKTAVMDRPAGREMMQNLKRGDHVVVAHIDRMFRSFVNFAVTMEVFEKRGITVHILDMPMKRIGPDDHMGRMFLALLAVFADHERRMIAIRSKEGLALMAAEGHKFGPNARYGYKIKTVFSKRLGKNIMVEEPHEPEQRVIRKMLELHVQGWSCERIALYMNHTARIRTRLGKEWSHSRVQVCLRTAAEAMAAEQHTKAGNEVFEPLIRPQDETLVYEDEISDIPEDLEEEEEVEDL